MGPYDKNHNLENVLLLNFLGTSPSLNVTKQKNQFLELIQFEQQINVFKNVAASPRKNSSLLINFCLLILDLIY